MVDGQFNQALGLEPSDLLTASAPRAREKERMPPARRKASILVLLGLPLDALQKIACGFARVSVSGPSR